MVPIFDRVIDEFYDKCKDFLKEKIFDRRKLDELKIIINKYHREFCDIYSLDQNFKFQQYMENSLKLYEQYNAMCKIEPSYSTINEIQNKIISDCVNEFKSSSVSAITINSYYKRIFELINNTLYGLVYEQSTVVIITDFHSTK